MKKTFYGILLMFVILGCKEEEKLNSNPETSSDNEKVEETIQRKLVFEIDLTTSHQDEFRLFANDVFLNNDQLMNISISQKINKNEMSKKMTFEFPKDIIPDYNLGFSLGNTNVKDIKINSIDILFGKENYKILNIDDFKKYFRYNKFIEITQDGLLKTNKVDGKYNPTIFLRKPFIDKGNL